MRTGFIYDEIFLKHDYPDHPERRERLTAVVSRLEKEGILERVVRIAPRRATAEEVLLNIPTQLRRAMRSPSQLWEPFWRE